MKEKLFIFFASMLFANIVGHGQIAKPKKDNGYVVQEANYNYGICKTIQSKALNKPMPVLVFLPTKYETSKLKYPTVYLLHGVNGQPLNEQGIRGLNNPATKILEMAELFQVIIVTPITGNSFYINSPIDTTAKFATYVGEEIPKFIDQNFRTTNTREGRFLAGFSMGGYGAVSLLCRYPETFSVAINRAGVLNLATGVQDLNWDDAAFPIPILGSYWKNQESYHLNSCFNLINKIKARKDVAIIVEVGREDFLYQTNHQFRNVLEEFKIPYIYAEYPGGHEWNANCFLSMFGHLQVFRKTVE